MRLERQHLDTKRSNPKVSCAFLALVLYIASIVAACGLFVLIAWLLYLHGQPDHRVYS